MQATAVIVITDGFEEIEAVTPLDILRRGNVDVTLVGYNSRTVVGAHNISLQTDVTLNEILTKVYDCLILPGGPGCYNMRGNNDLLSFIKTHVQKHKLICAICAAPLILNDAGALQGKRYTAHPCTYNELSNVVAEPVVVDGNLITGAGPGTSAQFGLTILNHLTDTQNTHLVANSMLYREKFL